MDVNGAIDELLALHYERGKTDTALRVVQRITEFARTAPVTEGAWRLFITQLVTELCEDAHGTRPAVRLQNGA